MKTNKINEMNETYNRIIVNVINKEELRFLIRKKELQSKLPKIQQGFLFDLKKKFQE